MKESTKNFIDKLVESGESAFKVVLDAEKILKKEGLKLPSCYDKTRAGGKLSIEITENKYEGTFTLGKIPIKKDPIFGSKEIKYEKFAQGKNSVLHDPKIQLSEDGEFILYKQKYTVPGAIKFSHIIVGEVLLSFSGRHSYVDQLVIMLIAVNKGLCNPGFINQLYEKTKNPFLKKHLFNTLFSEMELTV